MSVFHLHSPRRTLIVGLEDKLHGIQLSRHVFSPEKCPRPALTNGHILEAKLLYSVHEKLRYTCASGYTTHGGLAEEEVQCLPEGWSSPPACREEQGTCAPVIPQTCLFLCQYHTVLMPMALYYSLIAVG